MESVARNEPKPSLSSLRRGLGSSLITRYGQVLKSRLDELIKNNLPEEIASVSLSSLFDITRIDSPDLQLLLVPSLFKENISKHSTKRMDPMSRLSAGINISTQDLSRTSSTGIIPDTIRRSRRLKKDSLLPNDKTTMASSTNDASKAERQGSKRKAIGFDEKENLPTQTPRRANTIEDSKIETPNDITLTARSGSTTLKFSISKKDEDDLDADSASSSSFHMETPLGKRRRANQSMKRADQLSVCIKTPRMSNRVLNLDSQQIINDSILQGIGDKSELRSLLLSLQNKIGEMVKSLV